jgi:arginine:ornithine antiporter/lysine permease
MGEQTKKLGVMMLAALVVSAMVGGGIFSLPQNMSQGAGAGAVLIAWIITGVGIFFLANTFRILADARPDATTGIYAYARLGFGRFAGFQMAWCYWLCNVFGNVAYAVLLMDALDYFFPGWFTHGNNIPSIIGGSCVIWLMNFLVLRGVKQAAFLNVVGTICKLVPIALFIVVMLFVFRFDTFRTDFWGHAFSKALGDKPLGGVMPQIKSTMLVTLWAFIGIEGAVVISGRAKSQRAVGSATVLGFFTCLAIYFLLSILPFGYMSQGHLAALENPSTAPILAKIVGPWGGWVMNLGVIIALLTSWLAFTIMIAQIPYAAALDGTFPRFFKRENVHESPSASLWVTSGLMQLTMIFVYFENNAWNTMLSVTSVMILPPYLACTAYLWKLCATGKYPADLPVKRPFAMLCGVAGTLYAIWMIYAAGLTYLLMAFCFLVLGIPVYIRACAQAREDASDPALKAKPSFTPIEASCAIAMVIVAIAAIVLAATGKIKL